MPNARNRSIRRILVTAGPTREMLDPVRFITNLSTGEMGYAIAREAKKKGFQVTLISGPTALKPPRGIRLIPIITVNDLDKALRKHFSNCDVLVMAAAVGDFIPVRQFLKKIPRQTLWKVVFKSAPDLVRKVARKKGNRIVIGFSLETENWLGRSQKKILAKNLDGIVANYYSPRHNPFGRNKAHVALIDRKATQILRLSSKDRLAGRLLRWLISLAKSSSE